jgi:hypothetical protein
MLLLPEAVERAIAIGRSEGTDWVYLDGTRENSLHRQLIGLQ